MSEIKVELPNCDFCSHNVGHTGFPSDENGKREMKGVYYEPSEERKAEGFVKASYHSLFCPRCEHVYAVAKVDEDLPEVVFKCKKCENWDSYLSQGLCNECFYDVQDQALRELEGVLKRYHIRISHVGDSGDYWEDKDGGVYHDDPSVNSRDAFYVSFDQAPDGNVHLLQIFPSTNYTGDCEVEADCWAHRPYDEYSKKGCPHCKGTGKVKYTETLIDIQDVSD